MEHAGNLLFRHETVEADLADGPLRAAGPRRLALISAAVSGVLAALVSGVALAGWWSELRVLASFVPGAPVMKLNTAVGMAAASAALLSYLPGIREGGERPSRMRRATGVLLGAVPLAIGLVTAHEHLFDSDLGIDELLRDDPWTVGATPGRPSESSTLALLLVGSTLCLGPGPRTRRLAQSLALAGALFGWLSAFACLYQLAAAVEWTFVRTQALPTSMCTVALSYGAVWLLPESGFTRIVASNSLAGLSARRLLPLAAILPFALGWLRLDGQRRGWFGLEAGVFLVSAAMMTGFVGMAWVNARNLERLELQRETSNRRLRKALEHAEAALARANAYLEAAPGPMLVVTQRGEIMLANNEAELLFDRARDALIDASCSDLLRTAERGAQRSLQWHIETARVRQTLRDYRAQRSSGPPVEVDVSLSPLKDDGCAVISIHDVSAHREAQRALQRLTERLQLATRAAHIGVWDLDLRTDHIVWDDSMYALYGLTPGAFGGRVQDWAAYLSGSNRQQILDGFHAAVEQARGDSGRREYTTEFCIRRPDGAVRTLVAHMLFQRDASGRPVRVIGTNTDVTQQREAEARLAESELRFRNAMEYAAIGMALVGIEGRFLKVNRALCDIVGYSEQELLERTFQDITHPDDLSADVGQMQALLRGETSHYHMEKRYLHRAGHAVWVLLSGSLVRSPEGEPRLFVAEVQDISQRKLAEGRLRDSLAEKEVLLREIHHRVKNNLQVISSMLNLQAAQVTAPEIQGALKDSQLRIQTMALLHEQLYRSQDLARIDFAEHVRELSRSLVRFYAAHERAISLELRTTPLSVNLDSAIPLGLLANELITNALKHAYVGRTSGRLLVELAREASSITLSVADDGIGFPPDFSFDTGKKMGTTLVRSLARQMRGTIGVSRGELNAVQFRVPASEVI